MSKPSFGSGLIIAINNQSYFALQNLQGQALRVFAKISTLLRRVVFLQKALHVFHGSIMPWSLISIINLILIAMVWVIIIHSGNQVIYHVPANYVQQLLSQFPGCPSVQGNSLGQALQLFSALTSP